jgi:protein TonB
VSLALHAGLIALALWLTQSLPGAREDPHGQPQIVFWPAPHDQAVARIAKPVHRMALPHSLALATLAIPVAPPVEAPPTPAWPVAPVDPFPGAPGPGVPVVTGPPSPAAVAPMDVRTVEEPPVLLSHPAPGYPDLLRSAGIEGRVVVEAVLDTVGRVERGSLRIVSSTHALFVPAASALVLGSRYRPARFGGMAVRVRIQVPVEFALRR